MMFIIHYAQNCKFEKKGKYDQIFVKVHQNLIRSSKHYFQIACKISWAKSNGSLDILLFWKGA